MSEHYKNFEEYRALHNAWAYFALFDHNASLLKKQSNILRQLILSLGVTAIIMAVSYQLWLQNITEPIFSTGILNKMTWSLVTRLVIILLPVTISGLIMYSNKVEQGSRLKLLRGAAEAIKQEIFRYRAQTGIYHPGYTPDETRDQKLARRVKGIQEKLMKSGISPTNMSSYPGKIPPLLEFSHKEDEGFFALTPEKYVNYRLQTQITFYRSRAGRYSVQIRWLNVWIIAAGAVGTILAIAGQEIWIALLTALVAALSSYLDYNQLGNTVTAYNQSAHELDSIRIWWEALSDTQKANVEVMEKLVSSTENVIAFEPVGWIQSMEDAFDELVTQSPTSGFRETDAHVYSKEEEVITDGAHYGPIDVPNAAITDGAFFGPDDVPDAGIADGVFYGPDDVPDEDIKDGIYYGPTDVPDAVDSLPEALPEDAHDAEPVDLNPNDLQHLAETVSNKEEDSETKPDFPFDQYPPDDEDIDVDDFLPGRFRISDM